jgi:anti-anti-sigma regulatory factor
VETLHRSGHNYVLLDLQDVQAADDAGLHVLHTVRRELATGGGSLVLRHLPAGTAGHGRQRP